MPATKTHRQSLFWSRLGKGVGPLLLFCLLSCSKKDSLNLRLPTPGQKQRPQIYVLEENGKEAWWGFRAKGLEESIGAHVEQLSVSKLEDSIEQLRVWTARPISILVLGPGIPHEAYKKVVPSQVGDRLDLALGLGVPLLPRTLSLPSPAKKVARFYNSLCGTESFNCELTGAPRVLDELKGLIKKPTPTKSSEKVVVEVAPLTFNETQSTQLEISVNWAELFQTLLKARTLPKSQENEFLFESTFLNFKSRQNTDNAEKLKARIKELSLEELGKDF